MASSAIARGSLVSRRNASAMSPEAFINAGACAIIRCRLRMPLPAASLSNCSRTSGSSGFSTSGKSGGAALDEVTGLPGACLSCRAIRWRGAVGNFFEPVGANDLLLEPALGGPGEQFVGARAQFAPVRDVVVEARAGEEQGLSEQQFARIDRRYKAARFAMEREQPARAKAIHAADVGVEPDRVVDDIDAAAGGDPLHGGGEILFRVYDD